jgi:hypothetical protein
MCTSLSGLQASHEAFCIPAVAPRACCRCKIFSFHGAFWGIIMTLCSGRDFIGVHSSIFLETTGRSSSAGRPAVTNRSGVSDLCAGAFRPEHRCQADAQGLPLKASKDQTTLRGSNADFEALQLSPLSTSFHFMFCHNAGGINFVKGQRSFCSWKNISSPKGN